MRKSGGFSARADAWTRLLGSDAAAWKRDLNQRAGIGRARNAEMGAIRLGNGLGQRQAEAVSAGTEASGRRRLAERVERSLHVRLTHADAGVADTQHGLAGVREYGRDNDLPAGAGQLD